MRWEHICRLTQSSFLRLLHFILALHPFGPGDSPMHRLIRAGIIATTEALRNFAWHMEGKHTAMHPAEFQPAIHHLTRRQYLRTAQVSQATSWTSSHHLTE